MAIVSCNNENPFLSDWNTPYGLPPFDKIDNKDYIQAVKTGIRRQEAEIDAILEKNDMPTFENTIAAYEHSGALLDKVTGVLFNLAESDGTEELQKVVEDVISRLTEHSDNIFMNPYFFERVKFLYDSRNSLNLTAEQNAVLEKLYTRFVANGVGLNKEGQEKMRELNKKIAVLEQKFSNKLLAETNSFRLVLTDSSELAGLPEAVLAAAAEDAKAAGITAGQACKMTGAMEIDENGPWLFTLHNPSYVPFMSYSARRDLREKMFRAYSTRGSHGGENDTRQVVLDLISLKIQKAKLLGYDIPADQILSDKMAGNAKTVDAFLEKLFKPAIKKAAEETAELQSIMDKDIKEGVLADGPDSRIKPWD
ncbi:peptidyl-dipeptidase Dcp, partial [gut metagenome]